MRSLVCLRRGSLSSYAYVLLCVWLLQQRQPPVLPVLQARQPHTYDVTVGPWRCSYNDQLDDVRGFGEANKETLAELVSHTGQSVTASTNGTFAPALWTWVLGPLKCAALIQPSSLP